LAGCKSTTLFYIRKGFLQLFQPFSMAGAQPPVNKRIAQADFREKGKTI